MGGWHCGTSSHHHHHQRVVKLGGGASQHRQGVGEEGVKTMGWGSLPLTAINGKRAWLGGGEPPVELIELIRINQIERR
ncbi:hypothetical protein Sjap_008350 [Stephania japonica]|uniref:Uncharacterized protein n=1 Tax=Stephania japonica TaxID=461633 RepID=A0AAP0PED3_9MAGN